MVSKSIVRLVRSLEMKKNRRSSGLFVAEGPKVVGDLMGHCRLKTVVARRKWIDSNAGWLGGSDVYEATDEELQRVSLLQHPQDVVAVFEMPASTMNSEELCEKASRDLVLALDGVQDPGNLGTIIRIADWFGIATIVCSQTTVDAFNPKVVQATMGSIARVDIVYTDIVNFLDSLSPATPIYGTLLDGENIYSKSLCDHGVIVMGNEGNGISSDVKARVHSRLLIPDFRHGSTCAESLNVAVATAIVCSEFRRR